MKQIEHQLTDLNSASRQILSELQQKEPSVELIKEKLDIRGRSVDLLGKLTESFSQETASEEEISLMKGLFDEFANLNEKIEAALEGALNQSREELVSATQQRKAEDGYNTLQNPDISYFK